ncbi:MAG: tetratricopeptide repeat protein [Flavobacteriaceae bacterium]|nr:tetratricopeptide repeat protein [Flavobacteriaceae bacterium]
MNQIKPLLGIAFVVLFNTAKAQKTEAYTTVLKDYNNAVALYENNDYAAAQTLFNKISTSLDKTSELKANIEFYKAFAAIKRNQFGADNAMFDFVKRYPTSLKSVVAYLEVGNYYFKEAQYSKAIKWFARVKMERLSPAQKETLQFNKGYSLFVVKKFKLAKTYFASLLNSKEYSEKALYYYGYIAYADKDYGEANKYLSQVSNQKNYATNISYYLADINFKMGRFEKAIEIARPLLKKLSKSLSPQISKIIGESYFNLKNYTDAIPYLLEYKGEKGQWSNNDYYQLGYAYYRQKDYPKAISWFNKIVSGTDAVAQNASYHLADCYLKTNNKTAALNAFRKAAQMDFDALLKEDAYYNYAQLSYDIGNPYNNVAQVLIGFLKSYPNHPEYAAVNKLLINAFMRSKDYKGALTYFKNLSDSESQKTFQKAAYFYGVQLFLEAHYQAAVANFSKSIGVKINNDIHFKSLFWRAEAYYRMASYNSALNDFLTLSKNQNNTVKGLNYNLGYAYFKIKDYQNAIIYFKRFISKNTADTERLNDSYFRLGDSYFASSNYTDAIKFFDKAQRVNSNNADYALYQKAMSFGFLQQNEKKIKNLKKLLNQYSQSRLADDALYELGNTYLKTNQIPLALQSYSTLINTVKRSPFKPKALLKKGLIYYNQDNNIKALAIYKRLVKDFNNAAESRQAVKNAKEIYSDLGEIDKYELWVKDIGFVTETDEALDKAMYHSAEKFFLQNNFKKATSGFKKYLDRFPNGANVLEANFYSAQSFINLKQKDKAAVHLENVIAQTANIFTEKALSTLALLYLEKADWDKAMPVLIRLEAEAEKPQNTTFAQSNLMKAYYAKDNFENAVIYAEKVLKIKGLKIATQSDAQIIIARSAFKTGDLIKAKQAYKRVQSTATGKLKAEALYYDAFFKHREKKYKASNKIIQNLASNYAAYKEFGAKGLIIMAQNFYGMKDAYQATYILESVIKNFGGYPNLIAEAKTILADIKTKEAKTNLSVKQNDN